MISASSQKKSPAASDDRFEKASELFLAHRGLVRAVAIRYAPSKEVVDDIVQETYVEFIARAEQWDLQSDIAPLLTVMTRNFARRFWRDHLRSLPGKQRRILEILQHRMEERDVVYGDREREALRGCIETLPPTGHRIVRDYYFHRIPVAEIAIALNKTPETLRRALCRYRTKLRSCIRKILQHREDRNEW